MKTREIREMSTQELTTRIADEKVNLENLRFQHATSRIQNTAALKKGRRLIAQMKSIIRERELKESKVTASPTSQQEE